MKLKAGNKVLKIQGGGSLPHQERVVEEYCEDGRHVEKIYFPEVSYEEQNPLKRIQRLTEAGNDPFEIAAAMHNIRSGDITNGRQISRGITQAEKDAGLNGDHQKIKAVCIKCGRYREIDHATDRWTLIEAKNQKDPFGASAQFKNNETLARRAGYKVSYKVPAHQKGERRIERLLQAGFNVIFV